MLRRLFAVVFTLSALLVCQAQVNAQSSPLDAVGTDAAVVLRLRNPKASVEKVAELVDAAKEGMGGQVRTQSGAIGMLISNPTLAGVDMEQDWYAAVYVPEGEDKATGEPEVVFIIPATDLKAMKKALDSDLKFMESGKYGIYTSEGKAAEKTAKRLKGEGKSILSLADKETNELFAKGDISVAINVKYLATVYADEIEQGLQQARQQLANLPDDGAGGPVAGGMNPKQAAEIAGKFLQSMETGLKDALSCTIVANISKDGVAFEDIVRFAPNSPTTKFLAKHKPSAMPVLAKMPASAAAYFGISVDMPELMNLSMELLKSSMGDKGKELAAGMKSLGDLKYGATVGSMSLGSMTEGIFRTVSVAEVSDPLKLRDATRKMLGSIGSIEVGNGIKESFTVTPDAETIGSNKADLTKVELDFDPNDPMAAMMAQYMGVMYGPEGMTTRSVFLKDRVVQAMGGGQEMMELVLTSLSATAQSGTPALKTRSKLSDQVNLLGLIDLPGTVGKAVQIVGESDIGKMFLPLDEETLKALELPSSYSGMSLVTEPQGLRVRTVIPVEQIRGAVKLAEVLQKFQGMGAGINAGVEIQEVQ